MSWPPKPRSRKACFLTTGMGSQTILSIGGFWGRDSPRDHIPDVGSDGICWPEVCLCVQLKLEEDIKYLREEIMKTETLQAKEEQTLTDWQVGARWLLFQTCVPTLVLSCDKEVPFRASRRKKVPVLCRFGAWPASWANTIVLVRLVKSGKQDFTSLRWSLLEHLKFVKEQNNYVKKKFDDGCS